MTATNALSRTNPPHSSGPLLTRDQIEIDSIAVDLMEHPVVRAARADGVGRLERSLQYTVRDGPATLTEAVDNVLFASLHTAVNNDPTRPRVMWSERLPYELGSTVVPGARYGGDSSDRIYRSIGVSPAHRYEVSGRRHPTHATADDFSVEAVPAPAMWGQALSSIQAPHDIDLAEDGSWTVIADSSPADGRRNHLHMPVGTVTLLVRDTLLDWANQVPSQVSVRVLDPAPAAERGLHEVAREGASLFGQCIDSTLALFDNALRPQPVNTLTACYRPVSFGVPGGLLGYNRFALGDDEALVITLDPISAGYLSLAATSPWMCSIAYDRRVSSLNDVQAQPDEAGTYTFVLAPVDPGAHNWIDTAGLRTGVMLARWECLATAPVVETNRGAAKLWAPVNRVPAAVRDVRVVPLVEVCNTIPPGQDRVDPERRAELLARHVAEYQVRLSGRPLDDSISGGHDEPPSNIPGSREPEPATGRRGQR